MCRRDHRYFFWTLQLSHSVYHRIYKSDCKKQYGTPSAQSSLLCKCQHFIMPPTWEIAIKSLAEAYIDSKIGIRSTISLREASATILNEDLKPNDEVKIITITDKYRKKEMIDEFVIIYPGPLLWKACGWILVTLSPTSHSNCAIEAFLTSWSWPEIDNLILGFLPNRCNNIFLVPFFVIKVNDFQIKKDVWLELSFL